MARLIAGNLVNPDGSVIASGTLVFSAVISYGEVPRGVSATTAITNGAYSVTIEEGAYNIAFYTSNLQVALGTNVGVLTGDTIDLLSLIGLSDTPAEDISAALNRDNHTGTQYLKTVVPEKVVGFPTIADNLEKILELAVSSGVINGMDLTDNGDGTISLSAGQAFIRTGASSFYPLYYVSFDGITNLALTDNATTYISLSWNAGVPAIYYSTLLSSFNCEDVCIAYVVYREGTKIRFVDARFQNVDSSTKSRRLFLNFSRFTHAEGGTLLSDGGALRLQVTSGAFYFMLNRVDHVEFDTTVAGTLNENVFSLYYRSGVGVWTVIPDQKTVNTGVYDNGTGPAALSNNKWGVSWVYVINDGPSELAVVMGQQEYATQADAEAASTPAELPGLISDLGSLIGFVVYEKNALEYANVLSAFDRTFSASQATRHDGLAGISGGAVGDYQHLTTAQVTLVNYIPDLELLHWIGA